MVDAIVAAPGVDDLLADLQIVRSVGDAAVGLDEIENLAPKLCRVTRSCHSYLLGVGHQNPGSQTPQNPGHTSDELFGLVPGNQDPAAQPIALSHARRFMQHPLATVET